MVKSRKMMRKRKSLVKRGGSRIKLTKKACPCSDSSNGSNGSIFMNGGKRKRKTKTKNRRRKNKRTKKQKGGFFREIRNIFDYSYYLGEKHSATLGGYPQPKSPDPTKDQNPNSRK